jgi:hypothetical protein
LTSEQLATALAESTRTGRRVGEVIVQLGFALPGTIAQALATPLKTEYGYAVGFGTAASAPADPPPVSSRAEVRSAEGPVAALRTAPVVDAAPSVEVPKQMVSPPVGTGGPPEVAAQTSAHEVAALRERLDQLAGELGAAQEQGRTVAAERGALQQQLEAALAHVAELEAAAETEALQRARDEGRTQLALLEGRLAELEQALSAALAEAARAEEEKAAAEQARESAERRAAELEAAAIDRRELERELATARAKAESAEAGSVVLEEELDVAHARAERAEAEFERLERARDKATSQLESAAAERGELEGALASAREQAASAERERATLKQAHHAAKTRLAELESAIVDANEIERRREAADERALVAEAENERLERAHDVSAAQIDRLERQLAELEHPPPEPDGRRPAVTSDPVHERDLAGALARNRELVGRLADAMTLISELEGERKDALAVARVLGEKLGGTQQSEKLDDDPASHYLFVPERSGYRLIEAEGPPPLQGATLELQVTGGEASTYVVVRVGAAPFPGAWIPCAYLVAG